MQVTQLATESATESTPRFSRGRQWPGERDPTRWDVHDANDTPAVTFLDRFRVALLHSEDTEGDDSSSTASDATMDSSDRLGAVGETLFFRGRSEEQIKQEAPSVQRYTYPMVLLSDCSIYPPGLDQLHTAFLTAFKQHIYIDAVDVIDATTIPTSPPYLQFAIACLSSATSASATSETSPYYATAFGGTNRAEISAGLFVAGVSLWSVMLEVDNREARLLEAVIAVSDDGVLKATL